MSDLEQALNYVSGAFHPNEHAVTLARRVAELEAALREIHEMRLDESRSVEQAGNQARMHMREIARVALVGTTKDKGAA